MTRSAAAGVAGIHAAQVGRWVAKSAKFATECAIAEQEAEARMTAAIVKAAPKDWRAAESWLKRRRPEEWGDTLTILKRLAKEIDEASDADLLALLGYDRPGASPALTGA